MSSPSSTSVPHSSPLNGSSTPSTTTRPATSSRPTTASSNVTLDTIVSQNCIVSHNGPEAPRASSTNTSLEQARAAEAPGAATAQTAPSRVDGSESDTSDDDDDDYEDEDEEPMLIGTSAVVTTGESKQKGKGPAIHDVDAAMEDPEAVNGARNLMNFSKAAYDSEKKVDAARTLLSLSFDVAGDEEPPCHTKVSFTAYRQNDEPPVLCTASENSAIFDIQRDYHADNTRRPPPLNRKRWYRVPVCGGAAGACGQCQTCLVERYERGYRKMGVVDGFQRGDTVSPEPQQPSPSSSAAAAATATVTAAAINQHPPSQQQANLTHATRIHPARSRLKRAARK